MITLRRQVEFEAIFLITIAAAASLFFVNHKNNFQRQFAIASNSPIIPIPTSTPTPSSDTFSQISPDGTKKVIMDVTSNNNNTQTYSFSVSAGAGISEEFIFSKILDISRSMSIPFNTFSPDNKYFFIQENAGEGKNIFVFKASGDPFSETEKYLDVTDLFKLKNTENNFKEATGWASESLIIINSMKPDNAKGSSYWFEIPSKAIIQLSTEF